MPIRYHCPHCGQHLSIASRLAGHQTKCPSCLTAHVVPDTDEPGSAPPKRRPKPEADPGLHTETKPQQTAERQTPARHVTVKAAAPRQPVERQTPERPTERRETAERETPERKPSSPGVAERPQGPSIPISYEIDPLEDDDDEEALVIGKIERKSDELDLIPMVDCVFLLLVFYMITASYALQKTIEMGKPAAEKKGAMQSVQTIDETAQSSVVVQIDAQSNLGG